MKQLISLDWLDMKEIAVDIVQQGTKIRCGSSKEVFSIIVAHYNRADNLPVLIRSIQRQQWHGQIEVIVVDDQSSDHSIEVLSSYPEVTVCRLEQNSGSEALPQNVGTYLASSDIIGFIDSDDYLLDPRSVSQMYQSICDHTEASMAVSNIVFQIETSAIPEAFSWIEVGEPGITPFTNSSFHAYTEHSAQIKRMTTRKAQVYSLFDLMVFTYHIGFRVFRKSKLIEVGGWPLALLSNDDYGLVLNLAIKEYQTGIQQIVPVDCDAYAYRITGDQATVNTAADKRMQTFLVNRCKQLGYSYQDLEQISKQQEKDGRPSIIGAKGVTAEHFYQ